MNLMSEKKVFDNKAIFMAYGLLNIFLLIVLLVLLILLFNDIYILSRFGFVIFVGIHLFLLFFIRIHYLCIFYDDEKQKIEFHYNKRYGLKWQKRSRTVLLPLKQFDGYNIAKDSMGISVISFFKLEHKQRFELGPFHIGILSKRIKKNLEESFGESL
jgi:hypothetical protein